MLKDFRMHSSNSPGLRRQHIHSMLAWVDISHKCISGSLFLSHALFPKISQSNWHTTWAFLSRYSMNTYHKELLWDNAMWNTELCRHTGHPVQVNSSKPLFSENHAISDNAKQHTTWTTTSTATHWAWVMDLGLREGQTNISDIQTGRVRNKHTLKVQQYRRNVNNKK